MLIPKKVKHRKWQKGRSRGRQVETRGLTLNFGKFGLKAEGSAWVSSKQIEAARRAMTNFLKREGRVYIRIFPDKPITRRPPETTSGGGKGSVDHYVFPVRPGRVLFELGGITDEEKAQRALQLAGHKMPMKTRVISNE